MGKSKAPLPKFLPKFLNENMLTKTYLRLPKASRLMMRETRSVLSSLIATGILFVTTLLCYAAFANDNPFASTHRSLGGKTRNVRPRMNRFTKKDLKYQRKTNTKKIQMLNSLTKLQKKLAKLINEMLSKKLSDVILSGGCKGCKKITQTKNLKHVYVKSRLHRALKKISLIFTTKVTNPGPASLTKNSHISKRIPTIKVRRDLGIMFPPFPNRRYFRHRC